MPYWVAQRQGPHHDAIDAIVRAWKADELDTRAAWDRLSTLYLQCRPDDRRNIPELEKQADRGKACLEYMITTWFPLYANMYASDKPYPAMAAAARQLERQHPGTKFTVEYEY